jgi:predicted molibdopterin-dependent oxidoreductase YjgC
MGLLPDMLPGGTPITDAAARASFEQLWRARWAGGVATSNGYVQKKELPAEPGIGIDRLVEAIERGQVKAMWIEGGSRTRSFFPNRRLFEALQKLEFLVVADSYHSPLTAIADVVLPVSANLEKDGTFTSFDRVVQRLRAAVPAMGESRSTLDLLADLSSRFGYMMEYGHPSHVMREIGAVVPGYLGISYAYLERGGIATPVTTPGGTGPDVLDRSSGLNPVVLNPTPA